MADRIFISELAQAESVNDELMFVGDNGEKTNKVNASQIKDYILGNINPDDFGTVKSVNNKLPDENGNISLEIPRATNPNLLDNWYFLNPVNQKGFSSEAANGSTYTIDRWVKSGYTTGVLSVAENGFTIDSTATTTSSQNRIRQFIEAKLPSGTYTLSVLIPEITGEADIRLGNSSNGLIANKEVAGVGLHTLTFDSDDIYSVSLGAFGGNSVTFAAVKLEAGDQQTLAHQNEDGEWVLNEVPDYAKELAKCQRYQLRVGYAPGSSSSTPVGIGFAYSTTSVRVFIPTPVTMRTTPAIEYMGSNTIATLRVRGNAKTLDIESATVTIYNNGVMLNATVSGAVTNELYALVPTVTAGFILNANL